MSDGGRVLVFIVAYDAERHIARTLSRVPAELFNHPRVHFLCIDDCSPDASASVAGQWVQEHGIRNATILRNPVNQGYGGNQKLGYRLAIDGGFDFVILLHGDGQYAPELLTTFIDTYDQTGADVVLGSRMTSIASARRGGMPWYKVVGNRVLTMFQNRMTGQRLSEYHTGYRGYSTRFLRNVPFETNTNDFHFDTEILYQAAHIRAQVVEFPIPTHYGDEICHVNGLRYALDVFGATLRFKLHQWGMLCSLKYRNLDNRRYPDKRRDAYSSHALALRAVADRQPQRVLDIGCGAGGVALGCQEQGATVTGIDRQPPMAGAVDQFHQINLDKDEFPVDPFDFDITLMLDVIEHLDEPERFLLALRNRSAARQPCELILTTPNVAFIAVRLNLLCGRFNYGERGVLDITHKRLFTRKSLRTMLEDCGYTIEKLEGIGVPFGAVVGGLSGRLLGRLCNLLARALPTLFAFQFFVVCRPKPSVRQLVKQTQSFVLASPPLICTATDLEARGLTAEATEVTEIGRKSH